VTAPGQQPEAGAEPVVPVVPAPLDAPVPEREPVSGHRECMGCGFDLVGLKRSAKCPECERPVARTLDVPLLRERAGAARRALTGLWIVTGTCIAGPGVVMSLALLANFFSLSWAIEWLMEYVLPWAALAALLTGSWLVALAMPRRTPARRWCLAGAWVWVVVIGLTISVLAMDAMLQQSWSSPAHSAARLLIALQWCASALCVLLGAQALLLPMACGAVARHIDRYHLRTQTRRYRMLSMMLLLPGATVAAVMLAVLLLELGSLVPASFERFLQVGALGYALLLLGWFLYTLLTLGRLIMGVRIEHRAARAAVGAAA
jgi:hypothetical protein